MTDRNDPESVWEIEREIERERAALSDSIENLRDEYSPERLIRRASETLRTQGAEFAQTAGRAAREHPVALAVTGVGLAWLIAGAAASSRGGGADADYARRRVAHDGGDEAYASSRASLPKAASDREDDDAQKAAREGEPVGAKVQRRASEMLERIHDGTEHLSEAARQRVHDARLRAVEAQHRVEREVRRGAAEARDYAHDQPLVAGALALALGAAIGAVLPRTRIEDATIGRTRDRALAEADRVFRDEMRALRDVAATAVAEGREVAHDAVSDAVSSVRERLPEGL